MKKRRLLSVATAGALVAAQMVMPVMAAGGSVDADITTKNAVIRVQVPTKLEVAVDEFEMAGDGSQINSGGFFIKNHSSVAVNVKTTSTVTTGANTTLKDTKAGVVEDAAGKGNAWLAVAAQTEAGKYGSGTIGDLTEANANVATVDPATKKAEQEFYLAKGSGDVQYKMLKTEATVPSNLPSAYASEYFELTADATINDDATLTTALGKGDVYTAVTADIATGAAVTKVADGATYDSNNTYYSMDTDATVPAASKVYAYAEQETVGGETEFRFIGKLSTGKQSGWTAADFSAITIAYDVTGVQASAYDEVKDDCVRGLYTAPTAPSIATADQTKTLARDTEVTIPVNLGSGSLKANGVKTVTLKGQTANLITAKYVSYSEGKITIPATAVNAMIASPDTYLPGGKAVLVVTFDDAAETPVEITVNAPAAASTP